MSTILIKGSEAMQVLNDEKAKELIERTRNEVDAHNDTIQEQRISEMREWALRSKSQFSL